jgi:RNA polymerase sigma factor (sigma-70 family)
VGATDTTVRTRPSRDEIEPAALDLIRRHGAQIMSVARRYSATPEDAEDAYQRGLEILLTKAPSTSESDLLPWIKTVVKHEAFAVRRQRNRHGQPTEPGDLAPVADGTAGTHERAERYERLRVGAEALGRLKPQEVRAMLLLAEGHSYKQIQEITGWTYTKVNRCLSEGRRAFLQRVDGIESGAECERIAPLISAFADGEASEVDAAAVRRHLRGCLACRAALRESREAPARVAALAPAGLLVAPEAHAPAAHGLQAVWAWLHARATELAVRGQELFEAASAHKAAAIAASAAAIACGGVATMEAAAPSHHRHAHPPAAARHPLSDTPAPQAKPPASRREHIRTAHRAPGAAPAARTTSPPPIGDRAEPAPPPPAPSAPRPRPSSRAPKPGAPGEFGP